MAASIALEHLKDMQLHYSKIRCNIFEHLWNRSLNNISRLCFFVFLLLALSRSILLIKG